MSTMSLGISLFHAHRSSRWAQVKHQVAEWRSRVRSRHELLNLSDRTLRDIGLTRCDAGFEASKPFWLP
jgi:uncharacterized protein YjiS (DUF1127 family)